MSELGAAARAARAVLDAAGYSDAGIAALLERNDLTGLGERRPSLIARRAGGGTPLETLVRMFIGGLEVTPGEAERALAPLALEEWAALGLVEPAGAGVRARRQLRCLDDLMVAFDFAQRGRPEALPADYVMGISPSTLALAASTVRRPCEAVLDLGSGCGVQALLAARHAERVIAVDRNPRATATARLNAALNGLDTVECRTGDLFGPVRGERFDLIVSNPPFIVSPDATHLFLSTERPGDELCRELAGAAPAHLADGGWCQFLANWAVVDGEPWERTVGGWFAGSGCDAWVLRRASEAPDRYAAGWIETDTDDPAEFGRRYDEWLRFYDARGITAIGFGLVTMRRREGGSPNWLRADDGPEAIRPGAGEDIAALFGLVDYLEATDDAALLDARLRLGEDVRLHQELAVDGEGWRVVSAAVRRHGGLGYSGAIDAAGAALLARCDGDRPVRTLVGDLAAALGEPVAEVTPGALATVRALVERGLLRPARPAG